MEKVTVCIPTLNRYDLLVKLIKSSEDGTQIPDYYCIIDNGRTFNKSRLNFVDNYEDRVSIITPDRSLGVAASWNIFINTVPEERIITNDDLVFDVNTIQNMVNCKAPLVFVFALKTINIFSLFLIRQECIDKVGLFDERISPNYAYFEDNDYMRRIQLAGLSLEGVHSNVLHLGSQTLAAFSSIERASHHHKFNLAKKNYVKKWGGPPGEEKYTTPFNRR